MDHCTLVFPKYMRENLLGAIHFGHAVRDSMFQEAADVWWPHIQCEIVEKAQTNEKIKRRLLRFANPFFEPKRFKNLERNLCWKLK